MGSSIDEIMRELGVTPIGTSSDQPETPPPSEPHEAPEAVPAQPAPVPESKPDSKIPPIFEKEKQTTPSIFQKPQKSAESPLFRKDSAETIPSLFEKNKLTAPPAPEQEKTSPENPIRQKRVQKLSAERKLKTPPAAKTAAPVPTPPPPPAPPAEKQPLSREEQLEQLLYELTGPDAQAAKNAEAPAPEIPPQAPPEKPVPPEAPKTPPELKKKPEPPKIPPAFRNSPQYTEEKMRTGEFQIDIEGIRAEQQPPELPTQKSPAAEPSAQKTDPENTAKTRTMPSAPESPPVPPSEKVREESFFHEEENPVSRYAPAFRKFAQKLEQEPPEKQMEAFHSAFLSSLIKGLSLLGAAVLSLLIVLFMENHRADIPQEVLFRALLGINAALGAAAGAVSWKILAGGFLSLFRFEPNRETLPAISFFVCFLQAVEQLLLPLGLANENIQFYIPVGILILGFTFLSRATVFHTASINAKFVFSDLQKYVPQAVRDSRFAADLTTGLMDSFGIPAINRPTDLLSDFLPISFGTDRSDTAGRNLAVAALILGGAAGGFTFLFTQHKNLAVTVMTAFVLALSSLSCLFWTAHPLHRAARYLSRTSGLAAGEQCVQDSAEINAVTVEASQLLPPSCVILNGIKTFEGMRIDEALLDAASLLIPSNSVLSDLFLQIISNRTEILRPVESVEYEDGMGLSGWINKKRILIGNRDMMIHHGIRITSAEYEQNFKKRGCDLVYLASAGELDAILILTVKPSQQADTAIQVLLDSNILMIVNTVDSFLTRERLADLYYCQPSCFKILPSRLYKKYKDCRETVKIKPASIVNDGSFGSMAASLVTARRIKVLMAFSNVIHIVGILLAVAVVLTMTLMQAMELISAPAFFLYLPLLLGINFLIQALLHI